MNIEFIQEGKDEVEFKIDNPTVAELFRVYLNEQDVKLAVWRKEHPSKPVLMKIQAPNVKKAVSEAASAIQKDIDSFAALIKKK